jgi:FMN-dependent NADH-azoreductase
MKDVPKGIEAMWKIESTRLVAAIARVTHDIREELPHAEGGQMRLLDIQSSPRGESSDSIALAKSFIVACKSKSSSVVVDTLNVWHERLPDFDYEAIGAKYKAVKHETMTEAESNIWDRIQSLIRRFQNADRIVIGTPMWNFGLPYKLKHLIDLVAQRIICLPATANSTALS